MHEFHAWIGLAASTSEEDDKILSPAVEELRKKAAESKWHDAKYEVFSLNGQTFLTATGHVNRQREEGEHLEHLMSMVTALLPGSWGLVYDRDDEMPYPPGPNGFRVRVISRGIVAVREDPFLSPCNPKIED